MQSRMTMEIDEWKQTREKVLIMIHTDCYRCDAHNNNNRNGNDRK